jgi:hypothetical protein
LKKVKHEKLRRVKAPEDWRSPGRFARFENHRVRASIMD